MCGAMGHFFPVFCASHSERFAGLRLKRCIIEDVSRGADFGFDLRGQRSSALHSSGPAAYNRLSVSQHNGLLRRRQLSAFRENREIYLTRRNVVCDRSRVRLIRFNKSRIIAVFFTLLLSEVSPQVSFVL